MISAKVVADSLSPQGHRLTTLEVVMPRYILAEFNTHRVLSKNSASSRAIPFSKMVKEVNQNPFIPYAWQIDHKGMQGNEYFTSEAPIQDAIDTWIYAKHNAVKMASMLNEEDGVTKQLCNRLLEPFMWHKVLVSGTEWENFFNLRCPQYEYTAEGEVYQTKSWKALENMLTDKAKNNRESLLENAYEVNQADVLFKLKHNRGQADIHMMFLAEAIYDAIQESTPKQLEEGQWHIPYGDNFDIGLINLACLNKYGISTEHGKELAPDVMKQKIEEAKIQISVARCARLSYQTLGDNPVIDYEKDLELYKVLSTSGHWSPFEHVARVMTTREYFENVNGRIHDLTDKHFTKEFQDKYMEPNRKLLAGTIYDKSLGWCRNFRGFIQQRALID